MLIKTERLMHLWQQAQDCTFEEMRLILAAAEMAATKKLHEIRKDRRARGIRQARRHKTERCATAVREQMS